MPYRTDNTGDFSFPYRKNYTQKLVETHTLVNKVLIKQIKSLPERKAPPTGSYCEKRTVHESCHSTFTHLVESTDYFCFPISEHVFIPSIIITLSFNCVKIRELN